MSSASKALSGWLILSGATFAQGTIGTFPHPAEPAGNPSTPEKVLLGKALFFEEQLSSDDTVACATCHRFESGGSDPRRALAPGPDGAIGTRDDDVGSPGVRSRDEQRDYRHHPVFAVEPQATGRSSPSVIGAAFFAALNWDQRAGSVFMSEDGLVVLSENAALESQSVGPIVSPVEMGHPERSWTQVTGKLAAVRPLALATDVPVPLADFIGRAKSYRPLFERAFGTDDITRERVVMALGSYQRTLVPDATPFDLDTLSPAQARGFEVFSAQFCVSCHPVDNGLFSIGQARSISLPTHSRSVKVPSLRNVGLRPRFMSSGQFDSLERVIVHYQDIGFVDPLLSADDAGALIEFLANGLTDPRAADRLPPFDRPTLHSERALVDDNLFGAPTPGSLGHEPRIIADVPARVGSRLELGLGQAQAGSRAWLLLATRPSDPPVLVRGATLFVDRSSSTIKTLTLPDGEPGVGVATYRGALPEDPALVGVELFAQWLVFDAGAAGGIAASRAARITLLGDSPIPMSQRSSW